MSLFVMPIESKEASVLELYTLIVTHPVTKLLLTSPLLWSLMSDPDFLMLLPWFTSSSNATTSAPTTGSDGDAKDANTSGEKKWWRDSMPMAALERLGNKTGVATGYRHLIQLQRFLSLPKVRSLLTWLHKQNISAQLSDFIQLLVDFLQSESGQLLIESIVVSIERKNASRPEFVPLQPRMDRLRKVLSQHDTTSLLVSSSSHSHISTSF
jgi:hypothetical protein